MIIGKGTLGDYHQFLLNGLFTVLLLKDGAHLVRKIYEAMPLSAKIKRRLFLKFAGVARATVKGTLVVAIVQGGAGGHWLLVRRFQRQSAVGCADGVFVADPGGGHRDCLDPGGDFSSMPPMNLQRRQC